MSCIMHNKIILVNIFILNKDIYGFSLWWYFVKFIILYGLFLVKTLTVIFAISAVFMLMLTLRQRTRSRNGELKVINLCKQYREIKRQMELSSLGDVEQSIWQKRYKKKDKEQAKESKVIYKKGQSKPTKPCLYVLDFKGSMHANEVSSLREEISAVLAVVKTGDQVLLRLESPGGSVHCYGLCASQLQRLRNNNVPLTIAVDKVAASGGYLMACVANRIVAAPFAIVGSIGVVAQIPNFNRLLKHHEIDIELHTAGAYKRTLTLFGKNSQEGREKFQQELDETHSLFKEFVHSMRPSLNINLVATGEHWYGTKALEHNLIDDISTSDELIMSALESHTVMSVRFKQRKHFTKYFTDSIALSVEQRIMNHLQHNEKPLL